MTREEFEKEYNIARDRYKQLEQYTKFFDEIEELEYKLKLIQEMPDIHHISIYKNYNSLIDFYGLTSTAKSAIKTVIKNDIEDKLNKIKAKIEEIKL